MILAPHRSEVKRQEWYKGIRLENEGQD
jgi:hypothetical protein